MLDNALSIIAPHHCCGCGVVGSLLCDNCKYNINIEQITYCVVCYKPCRCDWICDSCNVPYERAWVVGERTGVLQRLVGLYKFERAKAAYKSLAELLLGVLPDLPSNTVIVPIPTTSSRIRERGYDHMLLIARYVAKTRNLECKQLIKRAGNTKQRHASAKQRVVQAQKAFVVSGKISSDVPYLIVDDVITTGATVCYAAQALRNAGAKHVWIAVVARQTLG